MRNFKDPQYRAWRLAVLRRDKFACKKCGSRKRLQSHHIRQWATHPELRFAVSNGITLCRNCHGQMWSNEEAFAALCLTLNCDGGTPSALWLRIQARGDG